MIWKTCSVRVASRPATAMTTIAVSQPAIQTMALRGDGVAAGMAAILAQRPPTPRRRHPARAGTVRRDLAAATMMRGGAIRTRQETPMTTSYDAIVIGSGQAGPFLAVRLAQAGMKTALIEREHLGGTCVNDGCIPTKTLVASARAAHVARRAGDYGVRIDGPVSVDMKAVKARKDRVVAESIEGLDEVARRHRRT